MTAANLLQLVDVRDACCEFLQSQLHPTNCLGIKAFADLHGCIDLVAGAESYIESHFTEVLDCDEFLSLNHRQVIELIASDTITVPSEERVYEAVLAWVNHKPETRKKNLPELMENVRLPLLSKDYLIERVKAEPLMEEFSQCKDYIIEALTYHLTLGDKERINPASLAMLNSIRTKIRQPVGRPKVMLAIGGQAPKAIRSVEYYDFKVRQISSLFNANFH